MAINWAAIDRQMREMNERAAERKAYYEKKYAGYHGDNGISYNGQRGGTFAHELKHNMKQGLEREYQYR